MYITFHQTKPCLKYCYLNDTNVLETSGTWIVLHLKLVTHYCFSKPERSRTNCYYTSQRNHHYCPKLKESVGLFKHLCISIQNTLVQSGHIHQFSVFFSVRVSKPIISVILFVQSFSIAAILTSITTPQSESAMQHPEPFGPQKQKRHFAQFSPAPISEQK